MLLSWDENDTNEVSAAKTQVSVDTEGGLEAALSEQPRPGRSRMLDSGQEANILALACSPTGWSSSVWSRISAKRQCARFSRGQDLAAPCDELAHRFPVPVGQCDASRSRWRLDGRLQSGLLVRREGREDPRLLDGQDPSAGLAEDVELAPDRVRGPLQQLGHLGPWPAQRQQPERRLAFALARSVRAVYSLPYLTRVQALPCQQGKRLIH